MIFLSGEASLSYQEKDICEDADLFPSSVIRNVGDFVGENILEKQDAKKEKNVFQTIHLPLLERDIDCLNATMSPDDYKAGIRQTFAKSAYDMANRKYENLKTATAEQKQSNGTQETGDMKQTNDREESNVENTINGKTQCVDFETAKKIGAKTLADFLQDPLDCILKHKFEIGKAQDRDKTLESETPLEMDILTQGEIQQKMIESERTDFKEMINEEIKRNQLIGNIPEGQLGDFAKDNFSNKLDNLQESRDFLVRFNAIQGDFKDVIYRNKKEQTEFPPQQCLPSLIGFLEKIASMSVGPEKRFSIKIAVINCLSGENVIWTWKDVTTDNARDYLTKIADRYLDFLNTKNQEGQFVCVRYTDALNAFSNTKISDLKNEFAQMSNEKAGDNPQKGTESTNEEKGYEHAWHNRLQRAIDAYERPDYKALVIENVISEKRGWPDKGITFAKTCQDLFLFPLSAEQETIGQQD